MRSESRKENYIIKLVKRCDAFLWSSRDLYPQPKYCYERFSNSASSSSTHLSYILLAETYFRFFVVLLYFFIAKILFYFNLIIQLFHFHLKILFKKICYTKFFVLKLYYDNHQICLSIFEI